MIRAVVHRRRILILMSTVIAGCLATAGCSSSSDSSRVGSTATSAQPATPAQESGRPPAASTARSTSAAPSPTMTASGRTAIMVHADPHKPVAVPRTARPGLVHLHNTGADSIYVYRALHGNVDTFVDDINSPSPNGVARHFYSVDHVPSHGDVYANLVSGTYYLVDAEPLKIKKSWVSTLTVSGPSSNDVAPTHVEPISIDAHDALTMPTSISTKTPLRIALASHHDQVVLLFHVAPSVSEEAIADFVAHPSPRKYGQLTSKDAFEMAYLDGPQTVWSSWSAPRGRGVVVNLGYDKNGRLFFKHGQAHRVVVT